jgi:acetolactate synthase-1/2/3 large subunit
VNGALQTMETLLARGVDTCFANPGTSEMHFVAALDGAPGMRPVLALFEGVATGAADGYGRMAGRPAAVLLHLGPGLGNGIANLHNARRARTPLVALVGEHGTAHRRLDPPLTTDIEGLARPVSGWVGTVTDQAGLAPTLDAAVTAAMGPPATVATVVVPADLSWSEAVPWPGPAAGGPGTAGGSPATTAGRPAAGDVLARGFTGTPLAGDATPSSTTDVATVAAALRSGEPAALLVGGRLLLGPALRQAARVAAHCGAKLLGETFPARLERGAGVPVVERLAYLGELAQLQLAGLRHLVVADTTVPVSFFAYPNLPGVLVPDGCQLHMLAGPADDAAGLLDALAAELGVPAGGPVPVAAAGRPERPTGALTTETMAAAVGATLPEGAVVADEGNTLGLHVAGHLRTTG